MLQKSIFKKMLANGWLDEMSGLDNARWNYDTFTNYTVLDRDPALHEAQGEFVEWGWWKGEGDDAGGD